MINLRIQDVLDKHGITVAELARRADTTRSNIANTINNGNPSIQTLDKWAKAIGCSINDFFDIPKDGETIGIIRHNGKSYEINSISDIEKLLEEIKG